MHKEFITRVSLLVCVCVCHCVVSMTPCCCSLFISAQLIRIQQSFNLYRVDLWTILAAIIADVPLVMVLLYASRMVCKYIFFLRRRIHLRAQRLALDCFFSVVLLKLDKNWAASPNNHAVYQADCKIGSMVVNPTIRLPFVLVGDLQNHRPRVPVETWA